MQSPEALDREDILLYDLMPDADDLMGKLIHTKPCLKPKLAMVVTSLLLGSRVFLCALCLPEGTFKVCMYASLCVHEMYLHTTACVLHAGKLHRAVLSTLDSRLGQHFPASKQGLHAKVHVTPAQQTLQAEQPGQKRHVCAVQGYGSKTNDIPEVSQRDSLYVTLMAPP